MAARTASIDRNVEITSLATYLHGMFISVMSPGHVRATRGTDKRTVATHYHKLAPSVFIPSTDIT